MTIGELKGSTSLSFGANATISATQQRTGRRIEANELHAKVESWSKSIDPASHKLARDFRVALTHVVPCHEREIISYRGRRFKNGEVPSWQQMGPPPEISCVEGRYNQPQKPALYLCENIKAVMREPIKGNDPLWVQKYLLPMKSLKIGDFRTERSREFISQVLWFAEHAGEATNTCSFSFSQFIAKLVMEKFDGMLVPGVRGSSEFRYYNIVILRRLDEWETWVDKIIEPNQVNPQ